MLTQCHGLFCFSGWGCTRSWEGTQGCHCSGTGCDQSAGGEKLSGASLLLGILSLLKFYFPPLPSILNLFIYLFPPLNSLPRSSGGRGEGTAVCSAELPAELNITRLCLMDKLLSCSG